MASSICRGFTIVKDKEDFTVPEMWHANRTPVFGRHLLKKRKKKKAVSILLSRCSERILKLKIANYLLIVRGIVCGYDLTPTCCHRLTSIIAAAWNHRAASLSQPSESNEKTLLSASITRLRGTCFERLLNISLMQLRISLLPVCFGLP